MFTNIPIHVQSNILNYMNTKDILNFSLMNKEFNIKKYKKYIIKLNNPPVNINYLKKIINYFPSIKTVIYNEEQNLINDLPKILDELKNLKELQ